MLRIISLSLVSYFFLFSASAQESAFPNKVGNTQTEIDTEQLEATIKFLASDECQGRETATDGIEAARQYIIERLSQAGVEPAFNDNSEGYIQSLPLIERTFKGAELLIAEKSLSFLYDFYFFTNIQDRGVRADEFVFVGFGLDEKRYSDYGGKDIEGRVAIIANGELPKKFNKLIPKDQREKKSSFGARLSYLRKFNPAAIIVLDYNWDKNIKRVADHLSHKRISLESSQKPDEFDDLVAPVYYMKPSSLSEHLNTDFAVAQKWRKRKSISKELTFPFYAKPQILSNQVECANIGGIIRGEAYPDEYIVLSAHYDHLGMGRDGEIFNGADDNASGSGAILSIAESIAEKANHGERPLRSVMFVWFTAEEKGLLGSKYFVSQPPTLLSNIKANLNVDMIGRVDKVHEKLKMDNYIYVIGSDRMSTALHNLNEEAGEETGINFDYTFNDENDPNQFYRRSDHYNFAKNGVPVIFYFSGVHEDYHKSTDTSEKLNFPRIIRASELILNTTYKLINSPDPIEVDKP